jgi:integrase/recombinase XerC
VNSTTEQAPHPGRPAGWHATIAEYVTTMRAAGRSSGTVRLHRHYLGLLAAEVRNPWQASPAALMAFMAREGWSAETRKSARSVVRAFYRWAYGMGHLEDDPSFALPSVRVPPGRPRPTPEHLVRQLLHHPDVRLALMGMLGAYAGLRAAEIARVHGRDLVESGGMAELVVRGKGGKVRAVPILNPRLLRRLREVDDTWAFPNGYGSHLSPGHVSKLLSRALPAGWTAHTLRHRCGTQAFRGTRDLLAVSALLGHSQLDTTKRYVLPPDDALRMAVAAAGELAC